MNIYLLHNGVSRGEFFSHLRFLVKSLIDYAAIPHSHPLVTDECLGIEVLEIDFNPHKTPIIDGEVYIKYDEDGNIVAFKYIEDCTDDDEDECEWLYPDKDFRAIFFEEGIAS